MTNISYIKNLIDEISSRKPNMLFDLALRHKDDQPIRISQYECNEGYDLGCIQILVEGVALFSLYEEGIIKLDAFLGEYLPELSTRGERAGNKIRVQDLLAHATGYHAKSGVAEQAGFGTWDELNDYLSYTRPSFEAGTTCSWNGLGRTILMALIKRVTGLSLCEFVAQKISERTGCRPALLNQDSHWPTSLMTIDNLINYIQDVFAESGLGPRLREYFVPVIRNPVSTRSFMPVGYAMGFGFFSDGLWGQTANTNSCNLGLKLNDAGSYIAALAIGASALTRDLVIDYICTSHGFIRQKSLVGVMGSVVECQLHELPGVYTADKGDLIDAAWVDGKLHCSFYRSGLRIATISLSITDENLLVGDQRWNNYQIEFFYHPTNRSLCLTFGQITYVKNLVRA